MKFKKTQGVMPGYLMAGLYSVVHNYLLAIKATGTDDPKRVFAQMRETPVNDAFATNGHLRPDGRMVHDVYLVQVKKPSESNGPDDLVKLIATIPGDKAFRPMSEGGCPFDDESAAAEAPAPARPRQVTPAKPEVAPSLRLRRTIRPLSSW